MNKAILHTQVQEYINSNWQTDLYQLALKPPSFPGVEPSELLNQLQAKSKSKSKLPTWFDTAGIYFPSKVSMEQCSSEVTAKYKASLVKGERLLDVTGGFGVDDHYFSHCFKHVVHCEIDEDLSSIVEHNSRVLHRNNINCHYGDGIRYLHESEGKFDCIYLDPSRRSTHNQRVFLLEDCVPNVIEHLPLLLEKSSTILIKLAPILDISATLKELKHVKEVHVVSSKNEVKELLFLIDDRKDAEVKIFTINIESNYKQCFNGSLEKAIPASYGAIDSYLYEPNSAILKAGLFNQVSIELTIYKININSHLYTSKDLIPFPGRRFKVLQIHPYQPKAIKKKFKNRSFHIVTRNFGDSVAALRKKIGIREGNEGYLFFTTDQNNKRVVVECDRIAGSDFT